ncbi:hypothetical protein RB195_011541 [Necator americanus]|uniref:Uncharacterized protein n=1 Tax=Necator americanus TaxID=51031 RepID=A0ABR1D2W9_NECAM
MTNYSNFPLLICRKGMCTFGLDYSADIPAAYHEMDNVGVSVVQHTAWGVAYEYKRGPAQILPIIMKNGRGMTFPTKYVLKLYP